VGRAPSTAASAAPRAGTSAPARRATFWRALRRNVPAFISLVFIVFLVVTAILAPVIAPANPYAMAPAASLAPPSWQHPFGTDLFGRDLLSRVIYGTRISLLVGVLAVAIGAIVGSGLGMVAGISAGRVEQLIMRLIDIALAFPFILLAILILAFFGPGVVNVMVAVGIAYIPRFCRLAHASTTSLRQAEFVEAARALGAGRGRVLVRHVLPNLLQFLAVYITFSIPIAILIEAGLDYLGVGVLPPTPTWGAIINEGRQSLLLAPWASIFPSIAIMLTVLSFNLFGEAAAGYLDPKAQTGLGT